MFDDYDSGYLNDYGGGNVSWWQDYLRAEIERCNTYWRVQAENSIDPLQSTITAQEETINRYQALMSKHIVGKCPQCNYMASWPVCTKCGTPYPDGMNELGEK